MAERNPWTLRARRRAYANAWIAVDHDEVTDPGGRDGIYGVVRFANLAVGVVPLHDDGSVTLVGQYRYPLDRYTWEIPEGGGPRGEDPADTARRELAEETGLRAQRFVELLRLELSNSVTDEKGVVYLATGLTQGVADPESTEDLRLRRLPLGEAVSLVLTGELRDSLTVAGLLAAERHLRVTGAAGGHSVG